MDPRVQSSKTKLEGIHLRYLKKQFQLKKGKTFPNREKTARFDLMSLDEKIVFEMKSRAYPFRDPKERRLQHAWWGPHTYQIKDYKRICQEQDLEIYFIFILGHAYHHPRQVTNFTERLFEKREIYVLPWTVGELCVNPNKKRVDIGINKINR